MLFFYFFLILKLSYSRETNPSKMSKKEIDSLKYDEYMFHKNFCLKHICSHPGVDYFPCLRTCPQSRVIKYGVWWRY